MVTVSVVVPVYNERETILQVLRKVRGQQVEGISFEVIVVDDGSKDGSGELLEANPELYDRLIRQSNGGKGAAVLAALRVASGDYVLFQDADLEYDPTDYAKLVQPILKFGADVVVGSRFLAPPFTRVYYFWHMVGNRLITFLFNLAYNTTFSDIYSCYLLYRRSLVPCESLRSRGWEQHAEILTSAVLAGKSYFEVPVTYNGRTYEEGKKIRAHHIVSVIGMILRKRF